MPDYDFHFRTRICITGKEYKSYYLPDLHYYLKVEDHLYIGRKLQKILYWTMEKGIALLEKDLQDKLYAGLWFPFQDKICTIVMNCDEL